MQTNINSFGKFITEWQNNDKYFEMLCLMAQLSKLFSESETPYLDYRLAENLFCRYYSAHNDARSCTAYDAHINRLGIGIKTFILNKNDASMEKIAEFNKLRPQLLGLKKRQLALKLSEFRNERMRLANDLYNINESIYHIVGRKDGLLRVFNVPYEQIDIANLHVDKDNDTSIIFHDEKNQYSFNKSKSVLQKNFIVPENFKDVSVDVIDDPLEVLETIFAHEIVSKKEKIGSYVILPLYSQRDGNVPEKSGLNQWNAEGRKRDYNEVYISIPKQIHNNYPDFFPSRDTPFQLELPDGNWLSAKVCQSNGKALMSNPNKALGEWLLRKVFKKKIGELVTILDLQRFGIDSVCVEKLNEVDENGIPKYRISFADTYESYSDFIV